MSTTIKENQAGKADNVKLAAAQNFGIPQDKKQNPLKTTISSASCGDLQIRFESVEWLNKEDPSLGYDPPTPNFVAMTPGFRNKNNYMQDIALSSDPDELENLAKVLMSIAKFIRETGVDISKSGFFKNEIATAYEKFAPNGGTSKK